MDIARVLLIGVGLQLACVALGRLAERKPAAGSSKLNVQHLLVHDLAFAGARPLIGWATALAANATGGGFITLPSSGWALVGSVLAYAIAADLLAYWIHRAEHRFPALWAFHSLHHSDIEINVTTTTRHYWLEQVVQTLLISVVVGTIFKVTPAIIGAHALLMLYNFFSHCDIRVGFGRCSAVLNCPQFHRLHHSSLPEHRNCNYAAVFTFFDVLFGTYRAPQAGEYPPTGIDGEERPLSLAQALAWPWRFARGQRTRP
jgi:sterol desaturase/sphingolipid hydroxylase (fatty acid hydroxylase superfamily)